MKNHVILVTGAGQGIGRVAAKAFAAEGATVILLGKTQRKLEAVYDEIISLGHPEPVIFPMDLSKATEQDCLAMAEGIYQQLGRLDGILHNAAQFDVLSPLEIQTAKHLETMFKIHVSTPFAITKACMPLLKRAPSANVIFTSSTVANQASAYWGAHGISKNALDFMVNIWQQELAEHSTVKFHLLKPGPVQSPQRKKSHPGEEASQHPTIESLMPHYIALMTQEN